MTRMSAEERRDRLVEAAIRVMVRDGVGRATTRAIAVEAEMPLGAFHYAFRSKSELMALVTSRIAQLSMTDIDAAVLSKPDAELVDVVRAGLRAYFDHVVANPSQHLVTYELTTTALRDDELEGVARQQYDHYLEQNEKLLLAAAGLFGVEFVQPVKVVNRMLLSLMDGLALNWLARGEEAEARAVVDLAAQSVIGLVRQRD